MEKYSNLMVDDKRQRKIYDKGYLATLTEPDLDTALAKFERRNDVSDSFTYDDNDSFMAGWEFAEYVISTLDD